MLGNVAPTLVPLHCLVSVAPSICANARYRWLCLCGQCFGSIQHLKSRFGSGFTAEVKLSIPTSMELAGVAARIAATNGNHDIIQPHDGARLCMALGLPARAAQLSENGTGGGLDTPRSKCPPSFLRGEASLFQ